jgi:bifunctional DNA-binding transcriptional regulator/antitoxin component of YhaV-PrlF toxin-antitoxin module
MSYKVRVSKKNQATIPVDFLKELGLIPNQINQLVFYKDMDGDYVLSTSSHVLDKSKGVLKVSNELKTKLQGKTLDQIIALEQSAIRDHNKNRLSKKK